jgi:DNA-binding PadR family transcriptional regulator
MLKQPTAEWYGFDLMRRTGLRSGTLYPILLRLEATGWLTSRIEDVDAAQIGRPRRRFYRLTGEGERAARAELEAHVSSLGAFADGLNAGPAVT